MTDEDLIRSSKRHSTPTLRDLAWLLFRQRRVFVCVFSLVLMAAVLYACFGTTYQASMKVLVRRGRADAPVSAADTAPLDLTRTAITDQELNSEVELLRDNDVLRTVVEQTGTGGHDWLHVLHLGEGQPERIERAARNLARKIRIEPIKHTNLVRIRYAGGDPQRSANVLRALADAYLKKHTELHRPDGEFRFFEQQIEDSQRRLEYSKRQLVQFATGHAVVMAAQQRDLAIRTVSDLDASASQTHIAIVELQRRIAELQSAMARLPERSTTQVRNSDNPELLKSLKASLLDLQLKRTQLLTKFEASHRLVQEVDQQIAQAQRAIEAEQVAPVRDETTDKNPQYEWAKSQFEQAQVELRGLEARESAIRVQQARYRATAERLGSEAITQEALLSTEKAAQENYLLYVKKLEEARMDDALDKRGIVNVRIAEEPVAPALPVSSAWMVLAGGFFAAGAAGTGAAFAADYFDPAFRNPDDVLLYLNAPVLASLPRGTTGRISA